MTVTLLVMTNGRGDRLMETVDSLNGMVQGPIMNVVVNDDSGDPDYLEWMRRHLYFHNGNILKTHWLVSNAGFGGAIRNAWEYIRTRRLDPYIFHLEDDFTFNRRVDLWKMMAMMDANNDLAQMALMRQPWNDREISAGSVYASRPGEFSESNSKYHMHGGSMSQPIYGTDIFVKHNSYFTTNPCMYRRELLKTHEWPTGLESEGHFSIALRNEGMKFGYMGRLTDKPWITHIGNERIGFGY